MKNYEEMAQSVLRRRDAYFQKKKRRQQIITRVGIPAVCFCLIVVLSCMIHFRGVWRNPNPIDTVSSSPLSSLIESSKSSIASQDSQTASQVSNKQKESSLPTSSIVSQPNKKNSSKADSSAVTSSENDSQTFSSIEGFRQYMKKLYSSVSDIREQQSKHPNGPNGMASSASAAASAGTSSDESSSLFSSSNINNPGGYPEYDPPVYSAACPPDCYPAASSAAPIIKDDILDSIYDMVDSGWLAFPKLGDGNQILRLLKVKVNDEGIYYQYRFKDKALQSKASYDLMIALLPDDSTVQSEYQWVLQNGHYEAYTHDSITFTICHPLSSDSNTRFVYWKQFGQYYVAYYQGDYAYLSDILPELILQIIYLDE